MCLMISPDLKPRIDEDGGQTQGRWMVVIYNNERNSMDEVTEILMLATGCDAREAAMEMWEAHTFGKAPVHFADREACLEVAGIIETIGVRTSVCREWED
jgi:ATP-dependent Clp protease adapter protein ClpS